MKGYTHWFGTMSVAPNGRIDVIWLDNREGGGSDSSALYYCYSIDQAETWSLNYRLSDKFDPHVGYPSQDKMGDYFDMTSDNTGTHLAWANTFNGEQDVYYSKIILTEPVVTSVAGQNSINVHIFPNPGPGKYDITGLDSQTEMILFNIVGQELKSWTINNSSSPIDITEFKSGLYFLQGANFKGEKFTFHLVKD